MKAPHKALQLMAFASVFALQQQEKLCLRLRPCGVCVVSAVKSLHSHRRQAWTHPQLPRK